jgi:antitoxin (DNA-binding transcriptional repressor) of toxin-antitoxin stability system
LRRRPATDTISHIKTVFLRELHEATGAWVRRAAKLGMILVTEREKPIARITPVTEPVTRNSFRSRRLRPGYARLLGTLRGGTDSAEIVSVDRDRRRVV